MPKLLTSSQMLRGLRDVSKKHRAWYAGQMPAEGTIGEEVRAEIHLRDGALPRTTQVLHAIMVFARVKGPKDTRAFQRQWLNEAVASQT